MSSRRIRICLLLIACAVVPLHSFGQDEDSGRVSGHVMYAHTSQPARLAYVTVVQVPSHVAEMPDLSGNTQKLTQQLADLGNGNDQQGNRASVQTDMNGEYLLTGLAPGDYYVFAAQSGSVSPRSLVLQAYENGGDLTKAIDGVSQVHVTANRTSTVNVALQRGAAISGTVMWNDGTPVPGAIVTLKPAKAESKNLPIQFLWLDVASGLSGSGQASVTNDRGEYRLFGLQQGDYLVQVSERTGEPQNSKKNGVTDLGSILAYKPLVIYAPAALHKSDAKPVTLHVGEEHRDENITINVSDMHTVSGHVEAADNRLGISSGTVTLEDKQDADLERSAPLDANGDFKVTFVPSGTYTMTVENAKDQVPSKEAPEGKYLKFAKMDTVRTYEDSEQALIVMDSDVTGQVFDLTPENNEKPKNNGH